MVCLHGTDPATIYLSAAARVDGLAPADLDRALYADRSLVKHMAMRRTLFVVPRDLLAFVQAGASNRVAGTERRRLLRDVEATGLHADGASWLARVSAQVLSVLADGRERTMAELRTGISLLQGSIPYGEGRTWGGPIAVGPRVLTVMSAAGSIVRASNAGAWTASRPRWTTMRAWLGTDVEPCSEQAGVARLVERWLRAFGPGTAVDLKWWLGSTLTVVRRALADVGAIAVDLDGRVGYLLPDDLEDTRPIEPWAALLPPLDPTTMGWFERDWYVGAHKPQVFDTSGNAGPTVWCDGRIVGGWRQRDTGEVVVQLLERVGREQRRAIDREVARLNEWLGGIRVLPRFPSPLSRSLGPPVDGRG